MKGKEPNQMQPFESRWPVVLAISVTIGILAVLPERIRLTPAWFPCAIGATVIIPIVSVSLSKRKRIWLAIERDVTLLFVMIVAAANIVTLTVLVRSMIDPMKEAGGLQLLTSSIAVWIINVLIFALLYWQVDGGGLDNRMSHTDARPDWLFPQRDKMQGWKPVFVDYLFLGYSTAAAFSAADVMPLTSRAKMLMMLEGVISLVTIVVVGARAIDALAG